MKNLARIAAGLVGLFSITMGLVAWVSPTQIGDILGLSAPSTLGIHTLRGDIGAVFFTAAFFCAVALFKGKVEALKVPIILYGLVLTGRLISLLVTGTGEGVMQPILIEVVAVVLSVFAYRTLKKA